MIAPRRAKGRKQSIIPASRTSPRWELAPPCEEQGGDKKGDDGLHNRDVVQTTYDKHLSSSDKQRKFVKGPKRRRAKTPRTVNFQLVATAA
ncbi:hypothetical protein MRX96_014463 [Rhipicephalus microplus]